MIINQLRHCRLNIQTAEFPFRFDTEENMTAEAEENWIAMGRTDEINIDQIKAVQVGPVRIILVRTESGYFALDSLCPHQGVPLKDGTVCKGDRIRCVWHGYLFDLNTGKGHGNEYEVETFQIRESYGTIEVLLPKQMRR